MTVSVFDAYTEALGNSISQQIQDLINKRIKELEAMNGMDNINNEDNEESKGYFSAAFDTLRDLINHSNKENKDIDALEAAVEDAMRRKGFMGSIINLVTEIRMRWNDMRRKVLAKAAGREINWTKVFVQFCRGLNDLFTLFCVTVLGIATVKCVALGALGAALYFFFCTIIYLACGLYVEFLLRDIAADL